MTHAPYSFFAHMEAVSAMMATPKSMPEATRPRISEPCKPAASIRGLPKLFSKTIVPINAKPRPANTLPFFMQAPSARILASGYFDTNGATVSSVAPRILKLQGDVIARAVFTSVPDLARKLRRYINAYSANAQPICWKYSDVTRCIRSNDLAATGH